MLKKLRQHGPGLARNDAVIAAGKRLRPDDELIDINPAVNCSRVKYLFGRPYPVQFRNQGAIDAWTWALETTEVWRCWQDPSTHCRQIRTDILRQFDHARPERPLSGAVAEMLAEDLQRLAVEFSVNLKNHLQKGTVIEATPALETLLTHSDVDLSLPMSIGGTALPGAVPALWRNSDALPEGTVCTGCRPFLRRSVLFPDSARRALRRRRAALDAGTHLR